MDELAKRLCAAWISYRNDNTLGYTYNKMKDNPVGDTWIELAEVVEARMSEAINHRVGLNTLDLPEGR